MEQIRKAEIVLGGLMFWDSRKTRKTSISASHTGTAILTRRATPGRKLDSAEASVAVGTRYIANHEVSWGVVIGRFHRERQSLTGSFAKRWLGRTCNPQVK